MSGDKLVFDLSQEIEGNPTIMVKKDWINIMDSMNQNYNSNNAILETSQLSNSNKWMSYREAYLVVPMLLTLSSPSTAFKPATAASSCDYALGLKNWFGTIFHQISVEYAGTTIIQQQPFLNMWNAFRLLTSLSWNDIITQGSTIGFYPDNALTWGYYGSNAIAPQGQGTVNNSNFPSNAVASGTSIAGQFNNYACNTGNSGLTMRQQYINFDLDGVVGSYNDGANQSLKYSSLIGENAVQNLWKSYIIKKQDYSAGNNTTGLLEIAVCATVYLKHLHSFFSNVPLLKGVYLRFTLTLNNCTVTFSNLGTAAGGTAAEKAVVSDMTLTSVNVPVGGVCPLMVASAAANNGGYSMFANADATAAVYTATLSVGAKCLNSSVTSIAGYRDSPLAQSIYLYIPAYTFNPIYEQAYLSSPIKQIKYEDIYIYQVLNIAANGNFNNLLTNGIANLKSVLIIPFYSGTSSTTGVTGTNTGLPQGIPVFQSPFDTAGTGTTSPLVLFSNFNVVISGQNSIYNMEMRALEEWNNQLSGCNSVNAGQTDGLTSGLINSLGFENNYCYYYVNVERMLPIEQQVPKSISVVGTNNSNKNVDLYCICTYGVEISVDVLTGSRVG